MKFSIWILWNSENHKSRILHFFRISRVSSWNLSDEMEISENSSGQESNHRLCSQETPNKPLDDACNICQSLNTYTISEFLMIILRKTCDGTTFHHLWDHKILFKCDDWILHVSEVRFGNRSRIESKLYINTQTVYSSTCEYWTSIAQLAATYYGKCEVLGLNPTESIIFLHICWM